MWSRMDRSGKISSFLKSARIMKNLTQQQVADKLGYETDQFISNWERGLCLPPKKRLKDLSKILGIEAELVVDMYVEAKRAQILRPTI